MLSKTSQSDTFEEETVGMTKSMKWDEIGEQPCSIARALSIVGDRWTLLVLRNAFMGMRRFDDFQQQLGVTRHVLADRLKRLVDQQILEKKPYIERQQRFEYCLTEKGLELYPVLMSMVTWADKWMDDGTGKPMQLMHKQCGQIFTAITVCSECKEPLNARQVKPIFRHHPFQLEAVQPVDQTKQA